MVEYFAMDDNECHGHDRHSVVRKDGVVFFAVADGMSSSQCPAEAAELAISCAIRCFNEAPHTQMREYRDRLEAEIRAVAGTTMWAGSGNTTLTIVKLVEEGTQAGTASFFAVGDCPIYLSCPGPVMTEYPDTRLMVRIYDKPLQVANEARVYSHVDVIAGRFVGRVTIGGFELCQDEVCLICSDGIDVISEHILEDLQLGGESHKFLNNLITVGLEKAVTDLFRQIRVNGGFSDDATLIVLAHSQQDCKPPAADIQPTYTAQNLRAYQIYEVRHARGDPGTAEGDWYQAEQDLIGGHLL